MIIGLAGKKGVGKDTTAKLIIKELLLKLHTEDCRLVSFADPLKEFIINVIGIPRELVYGDDISKNTLTSIKWENVSGWLYQRFEHSRLDKVYLSCREVLQIFGTDIIRENFGKDVWVNAMRIRINKNPELTYIIPDMRFLNEFEMIKSYGGKVWKVLGDRGKCGDGHKSVTELDDVKKWDFEIINNREQSIDDLQKQVAWGLKEHA
jgi:hypothetical protein